MKKILHSMLALLCACGLYASTITYTADNTTYLPNPERGFYHYSEIIFDGNGHNGLTDQSDCILRCKSDQFTLLFRYFILEHYNDGSAISQADFNTINADFAVARDNGLKVIPRFTYGSNGYRNDGDWSFTEPTLSQMQAHMAQLKPILAANADVIACVQAGFAGIWGEWFYTSTFGKDWSNPNAVAQRNQLINSLLDMTPTNRCVQLRSIHYITEYVGNGNRNYSLLSPFTAFGVIPQSRLGHHNDAFCASYDNWGTYYDYSNERIYLARQSLYTPIGGESAGGDANYYAGVNALAEMETFHYDYINSEYHPSVLNAWKSQQKDGMSYYDIMMRRLGYRFQLQSFTYPNSLTTSDAMPVSLTIYNAGFSAPFNNRVAYIVLQNATNTYLLPLQSDPRLWQGGQTITINESLTLPTDIVEGTYSLFLYLPDAASSIANRDEYAIRLANNNMDWNNGMNDLNATIELTTGTSSLLEMSNSNMENGLFFQNGLIFFRHLGKIYSLSGEPYTCPSQELFYLK